MSLFAASVDGPTAPFYAHAVAWISAKFQSALSRSTKSTTSVRPVSLFPGPTKLWWLIRVQPIAQERLLRNAAPASWKTRGRDLQPKNSLPPNRHHTIG